MTEKKRMSVEIRGGDKVYLKDALPYPFSGTRVIVTETAINYYPNKPLQYLITVKNTQLPLDVIHRGQPLIRDGHKIRLINKDLIVRP